MIRFVRLFAFLLLILVAVKASATDYIINPDSIYKHVSILADDSMEGREVGEPGEWRAAQYIKSLFESVGLELKGENDSYFQSFDFIKRTDFGENNHLSVNGVELMLDDEWQPMKQSASMEFKFDSVMFVDFGIKTDSGDGSYDDYEGKNVEGKAVVIKRFAPSSEDNPHVDFSKYESLTSKITTAIDHKAGAVVFITPEDQDDTLMTMGVEHVNPKDIPILFLRRRALEKLGLDLDHPNIETLLGSTELVKTRDTGYNVVGYLPGQTDTTIIIGAHYDHLGYGGPTSRYRGPEKLIHNGADDNGSGSAALLELARYFKSRQDRQKYSILFAAFSGEEAGLLGSSNYARNMTIDSSKVRMMINMDMIGRLHDQDSGLAVLGTGTCEAFGTYFDSVTYDNVNLVSKEPGTGPSDHTAFYNRGIPVLYFFTGAHNDYHKPEDDAEKIDADGIKMVAGIVSDAVEYFDKYDGDMIFQKTKDPEAGKRGARYSVTLGVMPDYVAEVVGLKIDGVSPDRPGERAGMLQGDIIIKMGDIEIRDIYDYMNSLGKFRKGDTTVVVVDRNGEKLDLTVIFE